MDDDLRARAFERRELAITADLARLHEAREFAAGVAAELGFNENDCYAIKLAMSEGVANAVLHGSQPGDPITLSALVEGHLVVFEVADTGQFVPRVAPQGELAESGRGLDFVEALMHEVTLTPGPGGTVLRFAMSRD
jgi:anti-sigma regulatory factor (Ser/Thr protein kinase)